MKNIFPTFVRFSLKQPSPRVRHPLFNTILARFLLFFFFALSCTKKKERKEEEGKKNVQISVWNARTHARGRKFFNIPAHPVSLVLARGIRLRRFVSKKKKKRKKIGFELAGDIKRVTHQRQTLLDQQAEAYGHRGICNRKRKGGGENRDRDKRKKQVIQ